MHLYNTINGFVVGRENEFRTIGAESSWDDLINRDDLADYLSGLWDSSPPTNDFASLLEIGLLAPVGSQEIWAAGVSYYSSRLARMEESKDAGGGDFYSRVYQAERPEIFMKATSARVVGPNAPFRIRKDSDWDVPEPELTLFATSSGKIVAYTIGNDVSSRSIEGENPLYLPQAKTFDECACLGPCLFVPNQPLGPDTGVELSIFRGEEKFFRFDFTRPDETHPRRTRWLSFSRDQLRKRSFPHDGYGDRAGNRFYLGQRGRGFHLHRFNRGIDQSGALD